MSKTLKLFLIRHAPVKRLQGCVPKYNPDALIDSEHLKILASQIPTDSTCFVSPLKRAIQTSEVLANYADFREVIIDNNLEEQNFGTWEGKKISLVWDELKKSRNQHNFSFFCPETCPPKGESYLDQCERVRSFIEKIKFKDYKALVIIAHAGTIRAFITNMLGLEPDKSISIEIAHLSITTFEILREEDASNKGGHYRLLNVNHQVKMISS